MNDKDLHTLLLGLRDVQPKLPRNQAHVKALLLREHTRQQAPRLSLKAIFAQQLTKGRIMKSPLTTPLGIVISVILLTGTASAAAYWFKTNVTSTANGDVVHIAIENCPSIPASQAKAVDAPLPASYSFSEKYQIIDGSQITREEIEQASSAMCEQRAIAADINEAFPDMQEFSATELRPNSKGLYFPIYLSGVVKDVQGNHISLENLSSNSGQATTATMRLADDALIMKAGKNNSSVKPGDRIYFAYQNQLSGNTVPSHDDAVSLHSTTDPGNLSVIRGLGVLTTDSDVLQKLRNAISSGAVKVLESDPSKG